MEEEIGSTPLYLGGWEPDGIGLTLEDTPGAPSFLRGGEGAVCSPNALHGEIRLSFEKLLAGRSLRLLLRKGLLLALGFPGTLLDLVSVLLHLRNYPQSFFSGESLPETFWWEEPC